MQNLNEQDEIALIALIIAAFIAIAILIIWGFISPSKRAFVQRFEGVVPPFIGLPAVLFSLTAALFATSIWENYSVATRAIRNESQGIMSIIALAQSTPQLKDMNLVPLAKEYARSIIEDEWSTLSTNSEPSEKTNAKFIQFRAELFKVGEKVNKTEFEVLVNSLLRINNARETRLAFVSFDVHPIRWYAILFLGVLVLIAVAFVHIAKPKALMVSITIATFTVLVPICMIALTFSSPYNGTIAISNSPYLQILK